MWIKSLLFLPNAVSKAFFSYVDETKAFDSSNTCFKAFEKPSFGGQEMGSVRQRKDFLNGACHGLTLMTTLGIYTKEDDDT